MTTCCTFKGILLTFRDCFTRISTKKWAQIIPFILLGVAKGRRKQKMEDTAGNTFHVLKAATKRSLHPKMYLLFNYQQLLRDGLGWNVAARGAVAACWLSISLCHLIHSLDSLLGPRESDQSMFRRQGRYITGADETWILGTQKTVELCVPVSRLKHWKESVWILPHWWAVFVMYNIHFSIFVARLKGSSICTLLWDWWKVHFLSY